MALPTEPSRDSSSELGSFLDRESSLELGNSTKQPEYDARTGRPIRRSAGQSKRQDGYVDSGIIGDASEELSELSSEKDAEEDAEAGEADVIMEDDSEADEDEEEEEKLPNMSCKAAAPCKKRMRTPSPVPPPLDPIYCSQFGDVDSDTDMASDDEALVEPPVTLQFNVPIGFHGPLVVKLDRSLLGAAETARHLQPRRTRRTLVSSSRGLPPPTATPRGKSFTELPPELRNKVYRYVFVTGEPCHLPADRNLARGGQLLSTCRLIHSEGCSILYGENKFIFDRTKSTRGNFWEAKHKEIGYTDIRRFLDVIGPENLCYFRDIRLIFDDAAPSTTHYLTHEERRYIHDEHLIEILRILRKTRLRELSLSFLGRRQIQSYEHRFLSYLQQIRTDTLIHHFGTRWQPNKISEFLFGQLKSRMERKEKLYVDK